MRKKWINKNKENIQAQISLSTDLTKVYRKTLESNTNKVNNIKEENSAFHEFIKN